MNWSILVLLLCFILLAFLLWKEITRRNKLSFVARILATVIAVASIGLMTLPVKVKRIFENTDSSAAIVVTDGYHKDSIQDFVRQNPGIKLFTADKKIASANINFIADLNLLAEPPFQYATLHVFGYGLAEHELKHIREKRIIFHATPVNNRITYVDWQQHIISGERLIVHGSYNNVSQRPVKIMLHAFNTTLDSALLPPKQTSNFELTAVPKHIDKAVYAISVLSAGDTLESNPVPVLVKEARPLNVLLLAASPDFDNKFLKNWLTQNEYGFAARTYISKNKYERQYVNITTVSLARLTPSLLEKFDVVVADLAELSFLPSSDVSTLRTNIENRGLGLIVKATASRRSPGFFLNSFPLIESRDSIQHTVKLRGRGVSISTPLKIQAPVYITGRPGTEPLITDQHARTLSSSRMLGLGKIIVTTVPNSYAWWLAGKTDDYASYWTLLLNKAAKKNVTSEAWEQNTFFPRKDMELQVGLQTAADTIPNLQVSMEAIHPRQHSFLPYEWSGKYWPMKSGWSMLRSSGQSPAWTYVYGEDEWRGILSAEKTISTNEFAALNRTVTNGKLNTIVHIEIPKIYFFLLFLISTSFLWFEKKYRNG